MTVAEQIANQLGIDESDIHDDITLSQLGADSLDEIEICMALEEKFGIDIIDEEWQDLRTVSDIIKYIESRVQ